MPRALTSAATQAARRTGRPGEVLALLALLLLIPAPAGALDSAPRETHQAVGWRAKYPRAARVIDAFRLRTAAPRRATERPTLPNELADVFHGLEHWVTGVTPVTRGEQRLWTVPSAQNDGIITEPGQPAPLPTITSKGLAGGRVALTVTQHGKAHERHGPVDESQWVVEVTPPANRWRWLPGKGDWKEWHAASARWTADHRLSLLDSSTPGERPAVPEPGGQFRLWRPTAAKVYVKIGGRRIKMVPDPEQPLTGHWIAQVPRWARGKRYRFLVTEPGDNGSQQVELEDPYAPGMGAHFESVLSPGKPSRTRVHPEPKDSAPSRGGAQTIFEAHLGGLTLHDETLPPKLRGTPDGVINSGPLQQLFNKLHLRTLELLPVHAAPEKNVWGYNSKGWFSFRWTRPQLKRMVDYLRSQGIDVIADVVFNHQDGSVVIKAWGEELLYHLPDGGILNPSGVGEALDSRHPRVRRLFLDALFELQRLGFAGVRVDCAPSHVPQLYAEARRRLPQMQIILEGSGVGEKNPWHPEEFDQLFAGSGIKMWDHGVQNSLLTLFGLPRHRGPKEWGEPGPSNLGGLDFALFGGGRVTYPEAHDNNGGPQRLVDAGFSGNELRARLLALDWATLLSQGRAMLTLQGAMGDTRFRKDYPQMDDRGEPIEPTRNPWNLRNENALQFGLVDQNGDLIDGVGAMVKFRRDVPYFGYDQPPQQGRDWRRLPGAQQVAGGAMVAGYELHDPRRERMPIVFLVNGTDQPHTMPLPEGQRYRVVGDTDALRQGKTVFNARGLPERVAEGTYENLPGGTTVILLDANDPLPGS